MYVGGFGGREDAREGEGGGCGMHGGRVQLGVRGRGFVSMHGKRCREHVRVGGGRVVSVRGVIICPCPMCLCPCSPCLFVSTFYARSRAFTFNASAGQIGPRDRVDSEAGQRLKWSTKQKNEGSIQSCIPTEHFLKSQNS